MRTRVTYQIFGDQTSLAADRVSRAHGIAPTKSRESGEPTTTRQTARSSSWSLPTGEPEDDVELSTQLETLLGILESRSNELWELSALGYRARWWCYAGSYAAEHAVEVSRALMGRLLAVPEERMLDFYNDEPKG
ncbi:DUF4279 domain-containing protein [Nakamurella antarctica]|uniref:DUF4279 domain-containing protein n=1 Tax=Nakamurella antarctica TaxID=1902245 RepID=A0A3G8ZHQ7_9ACTN|nr:DUF4279 domain-containing protein [Nakamurella antarctica]AZI56889.1 DUF4279 domain-containing protein [Nakamurella antarctica]